MSYFTWLPSFLAQLSDRMMISTIFLSVRVCLTPPVNARVPTVTVGNWSLHGGWLHKATRRCTTSRVANVEIKICKLYEKNFKFRNSNTPRRCQLKCLIQLIYVQLTPPQSVVLSEINFLFPVYIECLLLFNVMTSDSISGPCACYL